MISKGGFLLIVLSACSALALASDPDFSGSWKLNEQASELRQMPVSPWKRMRIEHKNLEVHCSPIESDAGSKETASKFQFVTDGKETKHSFGAGTGKTIVKWEGSALLVNTLVRGSRDYTQMDRWKLSRDGKLLTIRRQIIDRWGEIESILVYQKEE